MSSFTSGILLTFCLFTSHAAHAKWDGKIYSGVLGEEVSESVFWDNLVLSKTIVMGERHYSAKVQEAEGRIVREVMNRRGKHATLGWEFLASSHQSLIDEHFARVVKGDLRAETFLEAMVGKNAGVYAPMIEAAAQFNMTLAGINLTRDEKAPITKGGLKSADPNLIPLGYERGGDFYLERFVEVMRSHVPADKMDNYFEAQCVTDDVMAYQLLEKRTSDYSFVVAGSFHVDYFDGLVARLESRNQDLEMVVVKIVDASDFQTDAELLDVLTHPKYGPVAEFIYFVNEPQSQK